MTVCLLINFLLYSFFYPLKYQNIINLYAQEFKVDAALICAVINAESSFDKDAVSNKGAIGLMQIMPTTARSLSYAFDEDFESQDLFDENVNIKYGTYYLSVLLQSFDLREALCAYNAGPTKVRSWLKNAQYSCDGEHLQVIPFKETREYVQKVEKNIKFYQNKII